MINNDIIPIRSIHTQSNRSRSFTKDQRDVSSRQSLEKSAFGSSGASQNLPKIINPLVKQLNDGSQQRNDDQSDKPIIKGTTSDDRLEGTHIGEEILGLAGNDRIFGRQGNDILSGGEGRDNLYGGQGDDVLKGGAGNDYLSGGRGNNKLFGGEGDDTLASRLGSDFLDGGKGNDTARIRDNIENFTIDASFYSISDDTPANGSIPSGAREGIAITLTHKETGNKIETIDIENFRFNNIRLTLDEIKEYATPNTSEKINLSETQTLNALDIFLSKPTNSTLEIIDNDGDKKASIGDEAILSGGANGGEITRKTLTAMDIPKINQVNDIELRSNLASQLVSAAGTATAEDIPPVIAELSKLPANILQSMVDEESKVIVVRNSVVEYYPELSGVRPRGWPPGSTWDDVPGAARASRNELVVATTSINGERAVPPRGDGHGAYNLVLHEAGHIYDALIGGRENPDFVEARNQDIEAGRLTTPYLLQEGNAGRSETFASSVSMFYGGSGLVANELASIFDHLHETIGSRNTTVPTISIFGNELNLTGEQQKDILTTEFTSQDPQNGFVRVFDTNKDGTISNGDAVIRYAANETDGRILQTGRNIIS